MSFTGVSTNALFKAGRILKVKQTFDVPTGPNSNDFTRFEAGELCAVHRSEGSKIALWRRWYPNQTFWVHVNDLKARFEASSKTTKDDISIDIRYDMEDKFAADTTSASASTKAANIVRCMKVHLQVWLKQRRFLEQAPNWLWPLIDDETKITSLCEKIHTGLVNVASREILFKQDFSLLDLTTLPQVTRQNFRDLGGVYIIIYTGLKLAGEEKKNYIYIGSTNDFYTRDAQHRSSMKDVRQREQSRHCRIAHAAENRFFRALCGTKDWKGSTNAVDAFHYRLIVEQLFFGTFGSYRPDSVDAGAKGRWGSGSHVSRITTQGSSPFDDIEIFESLQDILDMDGFAASWDRVAQQANNIAEWTPATSRSSFRPSIDKSAIEGLNKQSPVSTLSTFVVLAPMNWLRTDAIFPGGKSGYNFERTTVCRLTHNYQSSAKPDAQGRKKRDEKGPLFVLAVQNKIGKEHIDFTISAKVDSLPKVGTMVGITFEVCRGSIHRTSLSGLPLIGPFRDWKEALTIAFRISWKDEGGKQQMLYSRRSRVFQTRPGASVGALSGYLVARAMLRYLLRQAVDQKSDHFREGDYDLGLARVKSADLDFFNRSVIVRDLPIASRDPIMRSTRKNPKELVQEMETAGLTHVGKRLEDLPTTFRKSLTQGRVNCDHCMIVRVLSGSYQKCSPKPLADVVQPRAGEKHHYDGIFSCTGICSDRGLPCSWTSHQPITPKDIQSWTEDQKWNPPDPVIANIARQLYRQPTVPGVQVGFDHIVEAEGVASALADLSIEEGITEKAVLDQEELCATQYENKTD